MLGSQGQPVFSVSAFYDQTSPESSLCRQRSLWPQRRLGSQWQNHDQTKLEGVTLSLHQQRAQSSCAPSLSQAPHPIVTSGPTGHSTCHPSTMSL